MDDGQPIAGSSTNWGDSPNLKLVGNFCAEDVKREIFPSTPPFIFEHESFGESARVLWAAIVFITNGQ